MKKNVEQKMVCHEKATFLPNPHIVREQCVQQCVGCNKMYSDGIIGDVCIAYIKPEAMHRLGCALQSNKVIETSNAKKVNPLKASRRMRRRGF